MHSSRLRKLRKLSPALALALAALGAGLVVALHRTLGAELPRAASKAEAIAHTTAQNPLFQAAPSPTQAYWVNAALRSIEQADRDVVSGRVLDAAGRVRARVDEGQLVPPDLKKPLPAHGQTVRASLPSGGSIELDVRGPKHPASFLVDIAGLVGAALLALLALVLRSRRAEEPTAVLGTRAQLANDLRRAEIPLLVVAAEVQGLDAYAREFGRTAAQALLHRLSKRAIDAARPARTYHLGHGRFVLLVGAGSPSRVVPKIREALTDSGAAFLVEPSIAFAAAPDDAPTAEKALAVAEGRLGQQRTSGASVERQTAQALLRALEAHDPRLASLSAELAQLAVAIGSRLGMHGDELELLGQAAELRDLGKLAIPQSVLEKAGPLDEDEWRLMRQHPAIGERIVCSVPALAAVGPILRATHERWDGTGYPDGKAGEDIPLASRVIAVCAAWQAMTGGPPYREPLSREQALAELEAAAGTQFDAGVVYLLPDALGDRPRRAAPRARALLTRPRG